MVACRDVIWTFNGVQTRRNRSPDSPIRMKIDDSGGISHVSFFPPELLLHNYMYVVWWLRPMLCYGEYTHDCKLKQFREMILTTLAHKQHDVI